MAVTAEATHVRFDLDDDQTKALDAFIASGAKRRQRAGAA